MRQANGREKKDKRYPLHPSTGIYSIPKEGITYQEGERGNTQICTYPNFPE
jgi:hypothetical protein